MKTKLTTIIIIILLLVAGILGGYFIFSQKDFGTMVSERENNEMTYKEEEGEKNISTSKVEEKINQELEIQELEWNSLLCQKNTYKSILKNYSNNYDEILEKYCTDYTSLGSSAVWGEVESNYVQYELNSEETKVKKYTDPINIKLARIHAALYYETQNSNALSIDELTKLYPKYSHVLHTPDNFYKMTGMIIMNGNNTTEEDWKNYARAKKIKVIINNEKEYVYELQDTCEAQLIDFEYVQNTIEKPINVKIEVLEKYNGENSNDVFISDIRFGFTDSLGGGI